MKRLSIIHLLVTALLIISLSGVPGFAAKKRPVDKIKIPKLNPMNLPKVQKGKLDNGIKLRVIRDDKLPLVTIYAQLKGGTAYEPASKIGLAGFTGQLLQIGGTKTLKSEELDKVLDSNGITLGVFSSDDSFRVSVTCLKEKLDKGIELLSQIMREPAFDKEKLEEIKNQSISAIARRNDQPNSINFREFAKLVYGEKSPFASQQEYEHIDNITREDIAKMHKMFFAPDNMLVGLVGPLEIDEVKKTFQKYFGDWNAKATIPPFPKTEEQNPGFKLAFAEKSDINQVYMTIGHLGEKFDLDQRAKIRVFNSIFSRGFSSRLMNRVRVKLGLTYGVSGGIFTQKKFRGQTFFSTYTKAESTMQAMDAIIDEIQKIRTGTVTEKELQTAKDYFLNSQVFEYETPAEILRNSMDNEFYGIPEDADKKFIEDVKNVTAADIKEVANKFLHPDKMVIFMVGNQKKINADIAKWGKVKKIDITIKPPKLKEKIPAATPETLKKGMAILEKAVKKNYEKLFKLKSLKTVMTMKRKAMGQMLDMGITTTSVFPDKSYAEMSIMGMKMKMIMNGNKGVMKVMGKDNPIPAKQIEKQRKSELRYIWKHKNDFSFQFLKEDTVDGKKYDVLYVFENQNKDNWKKMWIGQESLLVEIEESFSADPGGSGVTRSISSDFKFIKGAPFAYQSKTYLKGKVVGEAQIKEIQLNPKVDPAIFNIEKKDKK